MNTKLKRFIAFTVIICISLCIGFAINGLWNYIDRKSYPDSYSDIIKRCSLEFDVPQYIIYATINVESNFDPYAMSDAGAIGLMQMMPDTFKWLTGDEHLNEHLHVKALDDPLTSIRYGTYYLSYLFKKFNYNWDTAFAAYNAGEGNVKNWLSNENYSDGKGNLTDIPFKETKEYVKKINKSVEKYKQLYPDVLEHSIETNEN